MEWTQNGWPRIVPGVKVTDILKKPVSENVGYSRPLSDDLTSPDIKIQWNYGRKINPEEVFTVGNGKLTIQGREHLKGMRRPQVFYLLIILMRWQLSQIQDLRIVFRSVRDYLPALAAFTFIPTLTDPDRP